MQLYSENEKAFLLIHFNLNYGTDLHTDLLPLKLLIFVMVTINYLEQKHMHSVFF